MATTKLALVPLFDVEEGSPHPLGAAIEQNGVNFSFIPPAQPG